MNHHELKIWPEHYNNVKEGTKTFEIRVNDRGFQKGDKVSLYYYDLKDAKARSIRGYETPLNFWETPNTMYSNSVSKDIPAMPCLEFIIGDVYPIDAERVVFSLLPITKMYKNRSEK